MSDWPLSRGEERAITKAALEGAIFIDMPDQLARRWSLEDLTRRAFGRDVFAPPFQFWPYRAPGSLPHDWDPQGHMRADGEWPAVDRLGFFEAVEFGGHTVPLAPRLPGG